MPTPRIWRKPEALLHPSELLQLRFPKSDPSAASNRARRRLFGDAPRPLHDVAGGIRRVDHDVSTAPIVDAEGIVDGLESWIGDWRSVDSVLFKVKKADFQKGRPEWGKLHLKIHLLGRGADGSLVAIGGRADARTVRERAYTRAYQESLILSEIMRRISLIVSPP